MTPRTITLDQLVESLQPDQTLFVPGASAEPIGLMQALAADPARARGLRLVTSFVTGLNPLPPGIFAEASGDGVFMQPGLAEAQRDGRYRQMPLSYAGFAKEIAERLSFDTCIVQVSPPDADGMCSFGPAVEFSAMAMTRARRTVGLLNARTPRLPGGDRVPLAAFDAVIELDEPLREAGQGAPSAEATAIAGHILPYVGDGAALQVGIGKVPDALMHGLRDRRNLRLQTGLLSDSARHLLEAGALDPRWRHMSCVWVGSGELYRWLEGRGEFDVRGCDVTHDLARLIRVDGFRSVNSALQVDLFGQANLELAGGRAVSGVGGAADFARAAKLAPGGLSIIALPASHSRGAGSRIVPRLDAGLASLPRCDIDIVVTEHGAADLRGCSVHQRAERLIAIAPENQRGALTDGWREFAATL